MPPAQEPKKVSSTWAQDQRALSRRPVKVSFLTLCSVILLATLALIQLLPEIPRNSWYTMVEVRGLRTGIRREGRILTFAHIGWAARHYKWITCGVAAVLLGVFGTLQYMLARQRRVRKFLMAGHVIFILAIGVFFYLVYDQVMEVRGRLGASIPAVCEAPAWESRASEGS